ncbi:MAG: tetratricopeptide repeat protein [Acidobacteria bacterium]|nr:MAG: tetratricopeptide repeat protein [Acidobacteriota bacterium]
MYLTPWSLLLLVASVRWLVLPFENVGGEPSLNWKGSSFEEAISSHFEAAGYDVVDLETRNRRLMELGFDPAEPVSRATAIGLGKDVAAQRLIVGFFSTIENRIDVEARVVDLERVATIGIVDDFGEADDVAKLSNQIAKNLFRLERDRAPSGFDERAQTRERLAVAALEASAKARISAEPEEQRRQLELALSLEPTYLEARLLLGHLLLRTGEPRLAIDVLVAAGDRGVRFQNAYFDLGLAYLAVDEPVPVIQIFGSLTNRENVSAASYNNQGVALMQLGRYAEATVAFQLAMDADEGDTTFLFNIGWSQWRLGKGAAALEHLERAAELMPWDGEVHLLLSAAASSQANVELAERARATALMLSPRLAEVDPAIVTGLARIKGRPTMVRASVEAHAELEEDVMALAALFDVQALREQGRLEEAIHLLQRSLHRDPGAVDLRRELVELLRETGELDDAARELAMLLWMQPTAETHLELARVYLELEDPSKALTEVEKALALEPEHHEAKRLRAELELPVIE